MPTAASSLPAASETPNPTLSKEADLKPTIALFLLAGLLAAPLAAQAEDEGLFPYEAHVETLDNGLQVILIPMNSEGLAASWSIVRTGARDEYEPGRTGFAHFFEHMMFRGTERHPAKEYDKVVTSLGADANAFTSNDLTAYYLSIASEDLEKVMDLESDRFLNLSYTEALFRTEAGAVYGEYRKNRTNPYFTLTEALYRVAFTKHTYNHTAMGFEEDIRQMPELFDYAQTFFDRHYRPENVILLIVGDIDPESTLALAKKYYGDWEKGYVPPEIPVEPPQEEERRLNISYPGRTLPVVWMSYKARAFDPSDRIAVASELLCDLAFGETSAAYKKLVLDERIAESISAFAPQNRDPGLLSITSRVKDPSHIDTVIAEIDRVVAEMKENPPDPGRLEDLKSRIKYSFLMNLDTPSNVAGSIYNFLATTGDLNSVDTYLRTVEQVTPEDVQKAAQELLVPERRTVGILRGEN